MSQSTSDLKVLFSADAHLGYTAGDKTHRRSGTNLRVRDGYLAFRDIVNLAIEHEVDLFLQGGDIFHRSWPTVSDIAWAQTQLRRLADAGIPVVINTGNHDASNDRAKSPATLVLHDPARNINVVTDPVQVLRPVPGLSLHVLSHMGLALREKQELAPIDGDVNLLTAHGAAAVPGHEVFHCIDSPGEQPIGLDVLGDPAWKACMLGHYHGMGPLPGMPTCWYAGSSLRRGFSDPEGGRGAVLAGVGTSGTVSFDRLFIAQRPQHDLPRIDAAGMTGAQVEELIRENLAAVEIPGAIIRQVVVNCPLSVKRGIDAKALNEITADALMWNADCRRPDAPDPVLPGELVPPNHDSAEPGERRRSRPGGAAHLPQVWREWATDWEPALAETTRAKVIEQGARHLAAATRDAETGADADPLPAPAAPRTAR